MSSEHAPPPLTNLRGAGVQVDVRRVGRVIVVIATMTLLALSVTFFIAGLSKNHQITALRVDGVSVRVKVLGCMGELGGSGSNQAGYACRGAYAIGGVTYTAAIPGNGLRVPGSTVEGVTLRSDPRLLETSARLADEHASFAALVPSIVLFAAFAALAGATACRLRRPRL